MADESGACEVVVGFDGSVHAMQALDWALDEAELRGSPLVLCHAWQWPYQGVAPELEEAGRRSLHEAAQHVLAHGAECARQRTAGVAVRPESQEGSAAERLTELSAGAELLVLGSRGLGRLARVPVGSVAAHVAMHARCPVIVVRGAGALPRPAEATPVVAVVDASPAAQSALSFAAREAELRQLPLKIVYPGAEGEEAPGAVLGRSSARDPVERAAAVVQERRPDVLTHPENPLAPPPEALREAAQEARLLVVGAAHPAFGSVAQWLLYNAVCPIAVVPPAR
ncbi:nucleotide-binding universal stress UspA family protein [Actinomadura coerulea]|uniref:Nucleotide-binding universal stress UspA family protein n=1 Tax=Actinomadura coerulea TaxID=46159 RepID=A0A7X0KX99_9ACTN|nr:universal stress protein [Actinomadura coerulea]MBB6394128.1 nucleotide-binding universal stress UspA family protein [Actinomadura coerulea]GGQ20424.1 universal stress protein [Actinomadura coerulea]